MKPWIIIGVCLVLFGLVAWVFVTEQVPTGAGHVVALAIVGLTILFILVQRGEWKSLDRERRQRTRRRRDKTQDRVGDARAHSSNR